MDELTHCLELLRRSVRPFETNPERIRAFARIADLGQPHHAAMIFDFVFAIDRDVATGAADAINRLMQKVSPEDWASLYSTFHSVKLVPGSIAHLAMFPADQAVHLLGIASLNGSGYVREEALRRLGAIHHATSLPYILLRLADWVPQVRALARELVQSAIDSADFSHLVDYLYLLQWMDRVERTDLRHVRKRVIVAISLRNPGELRRGLDSNSQNVRDFCYRALLTDLYQQADLVEKALHDPAVVIRLWLLRKITAELPRESSRWLGRLLADRSPQIRMATLQVIPGSLWPELEPQVIPMVLNDWTGVREAARFYLSKRGPWDFAQHYRDRLRDLGANAGAGLVAGLAETGNQTDYPALEAYLSHPRAKVRAAAMSGLARLDPEAAIFHLIAGLNDPSGRVRRAAASALVIHRPSGIRELVLPVLERGTRRGRLAALNFLAQMGGWEILRDTLYAIASGDDLLRRAGWAHLAMWFARYHRTLFTTPTTVLAEESLRFMDTIDRSSRQADSHTNQLWTQVSKLIRTHADHHP